ncbi:MAG: Na+/H+ antiporter NhaC family protein [Clostridia bacterium]|nr:Na+/H+ antiporter NhaC family protein [Clostridia bacterium]
MAGTVVAFVPAIVAILLALITKQVYISLFMGIFVGAMCLAGGDILGALQHTFEVLAEQLGANGGILIFLVVLGIFAVLMVKSGGTNAYSTWAYSKIKSKRGTLLMGVGLGACFSIDDYFNCMTLGSVMRPISDKQGISHAKLSYLIHSSAAPFCIIAPISSWSAAIATYLDGGIVSFFKTIPLNLYAILAIGMVISTSVLGIDFFKMKKDEKIARETGDLDAGETDLPVDNIKAVPNEKGRVFHLIVPIILLVICCVGSMLYNGWTVLRDMSAEQLIEEVGHPSIEFFDLFAECDSSIALAVGSAIALFLTIILYLATKVVTFKQSMDSIVEGFESMVPAMLILVFAWTLSAIMGAKGGEGTLNAKAFVENNLSADSMAIGIIPFVFFVIAALIAFATGTSWGTFGVLIPIAAAVITPEMDGMYFLAMAAVLGGAVFGDNTSPISDTTIMASSAAHSNHLNHVKTQLPYASIAAIVAATSYLIAGFAMQNPDYANDYGITVGITFVVGVVLFAVLIAVLFLLDKFGVIDLMSSKFAVVTGKIDSVKASIIGKFKKNKSDDNATENIEKDEDAASDDNSMDKVEAKEETDGEVADENKAE